MKLNDTKIKSLQPQHKEKKHADGHGLFLLVHPNGSKYWRFRYRFAGKENNIAFGTYPLCSLKEARGKREEARKQISEGKNPAEQRKIEKLARHTSAENDFKSIAIEWHQNQILSWSARHAKTVITRLEADIFPALGNRPINDITALELSAILQIVIKRGANDIAKRLLQTCGQVFRYAIVTGKASNDITAGLKGMLPSVKKSHHNKLSEKELPDFLYKLEKYDGEYDGDQLTKHALQLVVLTFVRTNELIGARWEEIDWNAKQWRIPASRMKMREEHIVPLSNQVLEILQQLRLRTGNNVLLFPSRTKPMGTISNNTMLYALYRMGYKGRTTVHGFRALASTILNENGFRSDVIERQLAHGERNNVRAAYNHAQYLSERVKMMQWWADYIDNKRS